MQSALQRHDAPDDPRPSAAPLALPTSASDVVPAATRTLAVTTRGRRQLTVALTLSLVVHGVTFFAHWNGGRPSPASRPTVRVLQTRVVPDARLAEPIRETPPVPDVTTAVPAPTPVQTVVATTPQPAAARPEGMPVEPRETPSPTAPPVSPPTVAAQPTDTPDAARPLAHVTAAPSPSADASQVAAQLGFDRGPQLLDDIDADLPAATGSRGGSVVVRIVVAENGRVEKAEVVRSNPPGLFDAAAVAAALKARFAPALRAGVPVRSEIVFEMTVAPASRGQDASGRTY